MWHGKNTQPNTPYRLVLTTQLKHLASLAKWLCVRLGTKCVGSNPVAITQPVTLYESILATRKIHHGNDDCSVQYCILRTDTFLQVNCRCNGQSLFKDFVKLVSKLVVGGMEQLIEVSFILILFNVNINIKIKIPRSIFLFLKILVEKGK